MLFHSAVEARLNSVPAMWTLLKDQIRKNSPWNLPGREVYKFSEKVIFSFHPLFVGFHTQGTNYGGCWKTFQRLFGVSGRTPRKASPDDTQCHLMSYLDWEIHSYSHVESCARIS